MDNEFVKEVYCFLVKYDGEAPSLERLEKMVWLLADWQNRKYVEITLKLDEEIEKVKEGKPDSDLKKLLIFN